MPRLDALRDVHGHDAARYVRHAAGHDGHQFAARGFRKERPDGERRLGLPHEDGCGHVHAFGAGDAHGLEHYPRQSANDDLHHADVVEHRKESRDEDDGRQDLEGEDGAERGVGRAECAEQHRRAGRGGSASIWSPRRRPSHRPLPEVETQHEEGKDKSAGSVPTPRCASEYACGPSSQAMPPAERPKSPALR